MRNFYKRLISVLALYVSTFIFLLYLLPEGTSPIPLFVLWTGLWGAVYLFVEVK